MHQLNLPIQLGSEAEFASYLAGPNAEALAAITAWSMGTGDDFIYLFGLQDSGKTHLLQAACQQAAQQDASAVYLPLGHVDLTPSVLDNLELRDMVALDDVQAIAGDREWERGLFDLYNRLRDTGRRLLASADAPASELPLGLADLRSRLSWGPGYRLRPLSEDDCARLLRESAQRRGLTLGTDAIGYIMRRCRRDAGSLLTLLEEIDRESLRTQRHPTRRLIRELLGPNA